MLCLLEETCEGKVHKKGRRARNNLFAKVCSERKVCCGYPDNDEKLNMKMYVLTAAAISEQTLFRKNTYEGWQQLTVIQPATQGSCGAFFQLWNCRGTIYKRDRSNEAHKVPSPKKEGE